MISLLLVLIVLTNTVAQNSPRHSACVVSALTAEQDHRRLLDLLHISILRRGADGDPNSSNAANRDEAQAGPFSPLPELLVLKNGNRVKDAKTWWRERRLEIVEDFEREIYGRVPKNVPRVHWRVVDTKRESVAEIAVITKTLIGEADNSRCPSIAVKIQASLTVPARSRGAVPVVMELAFSPEVRAAFARRAAQAGRGDPFAEAELAWHRQVVANGWGYAQYIPTSVQADNGSGLTAGIIGLTNQGQLRALEDWGALRAWAWGASRVLDYFETDPAVNAKAVAIEGLSRYGKAALIAMAFDTRFAVGLIASSGEGGAKLWRRNFGEQLENLASTGEYHWMAGTFLKYAGPLTANDLPVDSHELIALCAPRPVFISSGALAAESWVDPKGMFLAEVAAGPVYRLLGKHGLETTEMPPPETPVVEGELAFRQHSAGHTVGPNWPTFIAFAARYLNRQTGTP